MSRTNVISSKLISALAIIAMTSVTFVALWFISGAHILGHDESVYATKARSWIEHTPAEQFEIYRPIAMPVFGWIVLQFSDEERSFRLFGVFFGALIPALIFLLFRRVSSDGIALTTVAIVVFSPLFLRQAPQFLNDIPSTLLLLATLLIIYDHFLSAGRSRWIYAVGPLAALAFYMRYAVITPLACIALFSYLLLLPRFLKKKGHDFTMLGKAILISIVLFLPHFIYSAVATDDLFGILRLAGKAAHRAFIGDGLLQYIAWMPDELGGWVFGSFAIVGALVSVALFVMREMREKYIGLVWIGFIGLSTFIVTGLFTHAEARYVFLPLILLTGVGVAGLYHAGERLYLRAGYAFLTIVVVVTIIVGIDTYRNEYAFFRSEEDSAYNSGYIRALEAIQSDAADEGCVVWTSLSRPRASWYTRCDIRKVVDKATFVKNAAEVGDKQLYTIVGTRVRDPQISPESAERFDVSLEEMFRIGALPPGDLIVYRLRPGTATSTVLHEI